MISLNLRSSALIAVLAAFTPAAYAQQPPDTVASDAYANTASGSGALQSLQPTNGGIDNSAFGLDALQVNTTGLSNTAVGAYALVSNTSGSRNNAVGTSALFSNTTGIDNIAVGTGADRKSVV